MKKGFFAFWLFLIFAASVDAAAADAAETAVGFRDTNPRFCNRRQVCNQLAKLTSQIWANNFGKYGSVFRWREFISQNVVRWRENCR